LIDRTCVWLRAWGSNQLCEFCQPLTEGRYIGTVKHDVRRAGILAVALYSEVNLMINAIYRTYYHISLGKQLRQFFSANPWIASIEE
jgi:hypothetical protein